MAGAGALRALGRHWKVTAVSAFSLSVAFALGVLGLGVTNTLLLLRPSASDPDRLVMIHARSPEKVIDQISYPDYQYYRDHNHVFTDVAAAPDSIGLNDDFHYEGREVKVVTRPVSDNYFAVMGIRPYLGRLFSRGDDGAKTKVAVMTWSCWKRLGSDPNIVGKVLAGHTIIGVTPKEFTGAFYGLNGDLFTTLVELDSNTDWYTQRAVRRLFLVARLKPGVSREQAQAEMTALSGQLASAFPQEDQHRSAVVARATLLPPDAIPAAELMSSILITLVLLVLAIACANVANLLLALAVGRRKETAIKLALGAPRGRLIRELLKESTLLSTAGGALGFAVAAAIVSRYSDFTVAFPMIGAFSFGLHLRLNATVVAFTLVLMFLASLATGVPPALYASSPELAQFMAGDVDALGTSKSVRRNVLVVAQIAISTLALVGVGLCERNLYNLRHTDLGFSRRNLVGVTVFLESEGYTEVRGKEFSQTLRRTVAALPGVDSVSLAWDLPLFGASQLPVQIPEQVKTVSVAHTVVDADYFTTLGIPLLAGRTFEATDREGSPRVTVINQKMAELFFRGQDPVGKVLMAGDPAQRLTVVGIVADGKYLDPGEPTQPFMYYALSQHYRGAINVVARTKGDPRLWVGPMARALRGLGLSILIQPATLDGWMGLTLFAQRAVATGVAVLSGLALLLAFGGLFGAISYSVSRRRKELGIRVALGARRRQLLQMVLRQTAAVAGAGIGVGLLTGIAATVIFRSQLYGVSAIEWIVLAPVGIAMLLGSLAIAYLSARPWIAVDPMEAVRHS
jgi:predicted permease